MSPEYRQAYKKACEEGTETVHHARVMVVGHSGAGKTSLIDSLLNKPFNSQHDTTNGIIADPSASRIDISKANKYWELHQGKYWK